MPFANLFAVMLVAFLVPLGLGFFPKVRLPSVVVELVAGIILGPAVLGWIHVDVTVSVIATIGLSMLLFMAGLELDFDLLRGETLKLAGITFLASLGIALAVNLALYGVGLVISPLLVAITLASTSVGVVVPLLKDAELLDGQVGRLVIANSSIAEFMTVVLLTVFFSTKGQGVNGQLLVLVIFTAISAGIFIGLTRLWHQRSYLTVLNKLRDTTAKIRVRAAWWCSSPRWRSPRISGWRRSWGRSWPAPSCRCYTAAGWTIRSRSARSLTAWRSGSSSPCSS